MQHNGWLVGIWQCFSFGPECMSQPATQGLLCMNEMNIHVPPCIASALVTPIQKKGCTLDTANYRPIAVGEPSHWRYTMILNRRLVLTTYWQFVQDRTFAHHVTLRPIKPL